jgi:hypothetical protein
MVKLFFFFGRNRHAEKAEAQAAAAKTAKEKELEKKCPNTKSWFFDRSRRVNGVL